MTASAEAAFHPEQLSVFRSSGARLFGLLGPLILGAASLSLTLWTSHLVGVAEFDAANLRFDARAHRVKFAIEARMLAYEQVLRGGVALFNASDKVDRQTWRVYVEGLAVEENYPGIQGIGFSKYVTPAAREAEIQQVPAEGFPDFAIWPEGDRNVYTTIVYLEPFDFRNKRAFGFDMMSEPTRRAAMERARDTGAPTISGKVILKQETDVDIQAGFLTYVPVYRKGMPAGTIEERRAAMLGYVYSPFRMNELMRGILGQDETDLALAIYDGTVVSDESLTYVSADAAPAALFTRVLSVDHSGRPWTLVINSLPSFEAAVNVGTSRSILIAGIIITLLLMTVMWLLTNTRARALKLARDMTVALRKSEGEIRALNDDLERRVRMRTEELAAANKELESFAYSVSHDLRAPLRSIHGFTEALVEDYADKLDDTAKDFAHRIRAASIRMAQLIDDILTLSRIGRAKMDRKKVDMSALAQDLVKELRRNEPDRAVTVDIQSDLLVEGDETLIRAVLQNLIENAWKFTGKTEQAAIEIGATKPDGMQTFYVRDNGAGFDMRFVDKLFQPFQRLHAASEFDGTGIGLATVARIVRRHGGDIWAESAPGYGTTMSFTLSSPGFEIERDFK